MNQYSFIVNINNNYSQDFIHKGVSIRPQIMVNKNNENAHSWYSLKVDEIKTKFLV